MEGCPDARRLFRLAAIAGREGRHEDAEAHYRAWMALDPTDPRPAYGLSILLLLRGEYVEGFRLYEARCYFPDTGIVKPVYRPPALRLTPEDEAGWGLQTMEIAVPA